MTVSDSHPLSSSTLPRVIARVYALSDVGRAREHNEDSFLVADLEVGEPLDFEIGYHEITVDMHGLLFLVADGMGGAASGELASSMASAAILSTLTGRWTSAQPTIAEFVETLRDAAVAANGQIHQHARENPEHRGMGTTATIAGLLGDRLYIVQVGDSRAYLIRNGEARQLTKDQSLMQRLVEAGELTQEEAERSERRNIILQALGPEAQVVVDLTHQELRRGDILVLCSDGLSGLVRSEEIAAAAFNEPDVRIICRNLVEWANERGGPDNVTVVAARFDGEGLVQASSTDEFGYLPFPLEGTLGHQLQQEELARKQNGPSTSTRNDSASGEPVSSSSVDFKQPVSGLSASEDVPAETFGRNAPPAVSEGAGVRTSASPDTDWRLERRQRAIQPILALLGLVAVAALIWTALQWVR